MTRLGATGVFPNGEGDEGDEGELLLGISLENGRIVVQFGKAVAWLGLGPGEAIEIGTTLIDAARQLGAKPGMTWVQH